MRHSIRLLLFLFTIALCCRSTAAEWKIVEGKIVSRFAGDVDPKNPLPEYPRPQLVRQTWQNLNGLWDYSITEADAEADAWQGKILVPFPVESSLSGVGKRVAPNQRLHYRRTFSLPADDAWRGKRILLHFGAVDWDTVVCVNGREVGRHTGGFDPFRFDITDALKPDGEQTVTVSVSDPTNEGPQPRGKQVLNPGGIYYTPVTGIWQTVWLEPVPETSIERIKTTPDIKTGSVRFEWTISNLRPDDRIECLASFQGGQPVRLLAKPDEPALLRIPEAKLWTPDEPNLYDLKISVLRDGKAVDAVDSYFGLREISIGKDDNGITRMLLNGRFVFQHGPLDQGWWPDGLYTAPTDEALAYDIVVTKQLGFNMLRKHVKIEPARFYYHCDRLGILVWQDIPSGDRGIGPKDPDLKRTPESATTFEKEFQAMIESLYNHPSIIVWVPFNEGWGQYDTCRILAWARQLDPTRLVDGPSGWSDRGCGDMIDMHAYRGPGMFQAEGKRASVLGEYGGLGLPVKGHSWVESDKNWGYGGNLKDRDDLLNVYRQLNMKMHPMIAKGLSAAVYTQTTDVEVEVNGLMTYDRKVVKVDVEAFKKSNDSLRYAPPAWKIVASTAPRRAVDWSYTTENPGEGWEKPGFDDKPWKSGKGGFGTRMAPNSTVRTEWKSNDIWIRRRFHLASEDIKEPARIYLEIYHDEDAEVYINGQSVLSLKGYVTNYILVNSEEIQKAVKAGENSLAVHCRQTTGGQYIDVGVSVLLPQGDASEKLW